MGVSLSGFMYVKGERGSSMSSFGNVDSVVPCKGKCCEGNVDSGVSMQGEVIMC